MKTIEEKARAYDKALDRARKEYKTHESFKGFREILVRIFPELAVSEDEKVKNKLINLIKMSNEAGGFALHKWEADEMLAWLENIPYTIDHEEREGFHLGYKAGLEKQGEQKSTWTDNDRTMAFTLLRDVDQMTYISKEGKDERLEWLNSLDDRFKKE